MGENHENLDEPTTGISSLQKDTLFDALNSVSTIGGRCGLQHCSARIREGEIIGLAGLEGSGQEMFLRLASGIKKPTQGTITLNGIRMNGKDHHAFKDRRVVFMPTARLEEGLIPGLSIAEHVALQNRQNGFIVRWPQWLRKSDQQIAHRIRVFFEGRLIKGPWFFSSSAPTALGKSFHQQ